MPEILNFPPIIHLTCFNLPSNFVLVPLTSDVRWSQCFVLCSRNMTSHFSVSCSMVDTWFLMGSPMPMLGIVTFYVSFVLKIGPKLMASRKPFNLKPLVVLYNFSMILISLTIAVKVSRRISTVSKEQRKTYGHHRNSFNELNLFEHERQFSLESLTVTAAGLQKPNTQFFGSCRLL